MLSSFKNETTGFDEESTFNYFVSKYGKRKIFERQEVPSNKRAKAVSGVNNDDDNNNIRKAG
jgi:hypothetical protein